jgi:hypothetical protein
MITGTGKLGWLLCLTSLLVLFTGYLGQAENKKNAVMLYGRIEEISGQPGARLPIELKPMRPKVDTSLLKGGASTLTTRAATSYPIDWRGSWSGTLKVHAVQMDPIRWKIDPAEASKEQELIRPGTVGQVSFEFSQNGTAITLKPTHVLFSTTMDRSRYSETFRQILGSNPQMGGSSVAAMLQNVPYYYALSLGDIEGGVGVTGNLLRTRVMKNDLKQLAPGVVEQVLVTYDSKSGSNNQQRYGYAETVLRFTRQSSDQLYVQAACVSYLQDGRFEEKILMYGSMRRGAAGSSTATTVPAGSLEDALRQLLTPR